MNKKDMSAQGGKTKKLAYWASVTTLGIVLGVSLQFVKAWTEPTATAPNGNVGAPINSSNIAQTKAGALVLNTAGAATGLIVDKGNVGIGTQSPNAAKTNILDVKDVWVRDANSGAGQWASQMSSGNSSMPVDGAEATAVLSKTKSWEECDHNPGFMPCYTFDQFSNSGSTIAYAKYKDGVFFTRALVTKATIDGKVTTACDSGWQQAESTTCSGIVELGYNKVTLNVKAEHIQAGVKNSTNSSNGSLFPAASSTGVWNK